MRQTLTLHPSSRCDAVAHIDVDIARLGSALDLRFHLTGVMSDVRLPAAATSVRADELWRHTCFEAFVRAPNAVGYIELNFAPSTAWAAYSFRAYRDGMANATDVAQPRLAAETTPRSFTLSAALALPTLPADEPWSLALSTVIEETNGRLSYWALRHPLGKADFHHSDCFALELGPASRA